MKNPTLPTGELLMRELDWMRRLARQLAGDPERAEDLTQDALVVALERPPRDGERLRGWLRRVMQNLFREGLRTRANRRAREEHWARPEALPPEDDLARGVHLQRLLADLLLELEEPYRGTVLLRYYEQLPPREIARRQGVPVATVKSRLHRGLAHLRSSLDAAHGGDRRAWVALITPWLREPDPAAAFSLGGLVVNAKLWMATLVLFASGAWMLLNRPEPAVEPGVAAPAAEAVHREPDGPAAGASEEVAAAAPAERELLAPGTAASAGAPAAAPEPPPPPAVHSVVGRVLDCTGRPVAGLRVRLRDDGAEASTGPGGAFRIDTTAASARIEVAEAGWVSVRTGSWSPRADIEPVLVVARAIDLYGFVTDEWGRDLEGARIALVLPEDFESRFALPLDATHQEEWVAGSESDGSFELVDVPAVADVPGAQLRVAHGRYPVSYTHLTLPTIYSV